MEKYSFLMSCYIKCNVDEFITAVDSMINQSLPPEQIVIVCDGAITDELNEIILQYENANPDLFTIVRLDHNVGLGLALRAGTEYCRNEYIARMDSDDICDLDRCRIQIEYMVNNPDVDVVGSNIAEFIGDINNIVGIRQVPQNNEEIVKYMKSRCPMNHVTVILKKSSLEKAGGYMHWWLNEDSYLWVRMYLAGCRFYNFQDNLVKVRVGADMYARRGGYKYYKSEKDLFKFMYKNKIINWFQYQNAKFIRFTVQVLMPNNIRQWFFTKFARQKSNDNK